MSAIVTCAATLLRASYGEPAELDDATADDWRRIAYEARVQGDALRADLAQASVLLRASEARHEREHAADVEALRVLEATCTGLRGALVVADETTVDRLMLVAQLKADLARVTAERDAGLQQLRTLKGTSK